MTVAPVDARAEADRCPGVLRPHRAADGALLRLRVPGGRMSAESLQLVSRASVRFADGDLQLTSRANLQLRGVATTTAGAVSAALVDEVLSAGLLPHPRHERVRNILASPLTGLSGGRADLRALIRELDEKLCGDADLAELPGPFLFALDDGRGDLADIRADLGVVAVDAGSVTVRVADLIGRTIPMSAAADELIGLAREFLARAGVTDGRPVWHVRELPSGGRELLPHGVEPGDHRNDPADERPTLGLLRQIDGMSAVSVLVPLGVLSLEQCAAVVQVAEHGAGRLVITPWRGLIIPGLTQSGAESALRQLSAAGLVVADGSNWAGITACSGAPRCAQGQGDTRALAGRIAAGRMSAEMLPVHVVGCGRRCGSPMGEHVEALVLPDRVLVAGPDLMARDVRPADAVHAVATARVPAGTVS